MLEYQSIKICLQKITLQISLKKFLWLKKLKKPFSGHVIRDFNGEKIIEIFYTKELQKANSAEFRVEKVIKRVKNTIQWTCYQGF